MSANSNSSENNKLEQMVTFNLGQEEFGVNILQVQEIDRPAEITEVPQVDRCIEGVINLRGKVIPVISLRKKFGMPLKEYDNRTQIIVVNIEDDTVGMIVDSVSEVLRVPADSLEKAPRLITGVNANYIKAIAKLDNRMVIYLNLESIVATGK
jgi:purine-binding chemotaxis protein CheW